MTRACSKAFMRDIDQNQFQPNNTIKKHKALQGNNLARNEAIPNGEKLIKHPLSTYKDDTKRWLVTTVDEEQSKGIEFILRFKWRWDKQYTEKNNI